MVNDRRQDDPDSEATHVTTELSLDAGTGPPRQIGPFRLLERIGEGGMGEVYLAEQQEPVRRRVALKLIKQGMDTEAVVARFEAERQALAMMDHPYIAKVLDGGSTPQGRPYFVMDYVKGVPITQYCDTQRLTVRERLRLFQQVCQGVQHAHQKAVIHRDIKPSNILVTIQDDKAIPKIIDFGVAKATAQRLTERTLYTELGQMIGTPEYMSPEQAEMTGQDIDTRTDVYSLGVVLYELLVGALPFDSKELRKVGLMEIHRFIREQEPPRPSNRLSTLGDRTTRNAAVRGTEPRLLIRLIRGDLDWITLKALEKDRTRRYGSATELAADLERYLRHEVVAARPPSRTYRIQKFLRRNRAATSAAALVVLALAGFAIVTAIQSNRIAEERDRASREAEKAQAINEFMGRLTEKALPTSLGPQATLLEAIDATASEIEEAFPNDPEVRAQIFHDFGMVYRRINNSRQAKELFERALTIRRAVLGEESVPTLETMSQLALLPGLTAEEQTRRFRRIIELGGDDYSAPVNETALNLGLLLTRLGELAEAEEVLEQVRLRASARAIDQATLWVARIRGLRGDYDGGKALIRDEVLPFVTGTYRDRPVLLARTLVECAENLLFLGESCESVLPLYNDAIEFHRSVRGDALDANRVAAETGYASCLAETGDFATAEAVSLRLVEDLETWVEADRGTREPAYRTLLEIYRHAGRLDEAAQHPAPIRRNEAQLVGELPVEAVAGRSVTLSGAMRIEWNQTGRAYIWLRVRGSETAAAVRRQVEAGPFPGNRGWRTYEVSAQVPEGASSVSFGVGFEGGQITWVDELSLQIDGVDFSPDSFDLDFEGSEMRGFEKVDETGEHEFILDSQTVAASGRQSLKVWHNPATRR